MKEKEYCVTWFNQYGTVVMATVPAENPSKARQIIKRHVLTHYGYVITEFRNARRVG